jgi:CBS domain-containing protein
MMTPNPISITSVSTLQRAVAFLMDHAFSAAPVIDEAGRAVGVISLTDITRYIKKQNASRGKRSEYYDTTQLTVPEGYFGASASEADETEVRHVMTPMVFSVTPNTPASQVIEAMLAENVHRLFVVDDAGILIGVITSFDILKKLS